MPNPYFTGTVSVGPGDTVVVGSGTIWLPANVVQFDRISIDGSADLLITDVTDVTHLSIPPWPGEAKTDVPYVIYPASARRIDEVAVVDDLAKQVQALNTEGYPVIVPPEASEPDPSLGDNGNLALQFGSAVKAWHKAGGLWVFDGMFKGLNPKGSYNGATTYVFGDVVSSGGGSYISLVNGNVGHDPATSPTYWMVNSERGAAGVAGPANSLTIGTVAGGPTAGATITGTAPAQTLNLTLPKGADGIDGASALTVVRAAATGNVNLASGLVNGAVIDGITLATNDLVLLPSQTAPAQNGVYVVVASGAASRLSAFNTYDAHCGRYFSVSEGTTNHDKLFRCTSDQGGTLGTTAIAISEFAGAGREALKQNRTYYVRTDGSDGNTGLSNTSGGAFLTLQKAYNTIAGTLDLSGFTVTIQIGDGTYAPASGVPVLNFSQPWTGGGSVVIQGNSTTPANVLLSATSADAVVINASPPGLLTLKDFKLQTATSGNCINMNTGGTLLFGNLNFGTCAASHIQISAPGAKVSAISNYSISGSAQVHVGIGGQGAFYAGANTITLAGTPNFSVRFVNAIGAAYLDFSSAAFSGSATGSRYGAYINGMIFSNGGGANFFPGNAAGSVGTGGIYN